MGSPGKLPAGMKEQKRVGSYLKTFSLKYNNLILIFKKYGKEGRRRLWPSKDLLVKLKHKREMHRQYKQGHGFRKEYRDTA